MYWLEVHNMLGWCMKSWLWKYIRLHDKTTFGSSLPLCCFCMFYMCGSPFCDDHQLVDVSRCEEHPWSTWRWWFRYLAIWAGFYYFGLSFWGYDPCTSLSFNFLFWLLLHFVSSLVLASWCALDKCKELSLNFRTALLYYISVTLPLIMFAN